jgi:hypothetical protein
MASTFKRYFKQGVGVANTTVYNPTTAGIQSTVIGFSLCNSTNSTIEASATFSQGANSANAGANTVYLIKSVVIPAGSSLVVVGGDQKLVLVANSSTSDFIEVSSNTASSIDVMMSVLEVTP